MIEVVYKDVPKDNTAEDTFGIPKNVRQVGNPDEQYKIYIEDYVFIYLTDKTRQAKKEDENKTILAILLGKDQWIKDKGFLFISGALEADIEDLCEGYLSFSESVWGNILKKKEIYFPNENIVGWFCGGAHLEKEQEDLYAKIHMKEFGESKILMQMDLSEDLEAFYCLKNGKLEQQKGYYIYYEKNNAMQTYMLEDKKKSENDAEKVSDEAIKKMRKIIKEKKQVGEEREERASVFSYAMTAGLALAVMMVGINFYQEYKEPKEDLAVVTSVSSAKEEMEEAKENKKEEMSEMDDSENTSESIENEEKYEMEKIDRNERKTEEIEEIEEADDVSGEIERKTDTETASVTNKTYVIKPGDTLYQISMMKYGSSQLLPQICEINDISQDEIIYPGQVIVLP